MAVKRRRRSASGTGYGRPPKHTRFRPGASGNPKGRPKGSKSLRNELAKVLRERITTSGGKTLTLGKLIAKQLGHQAGKGDLRSIGMLLKELAPDDEEAIAHAEQVPFAREEHEVVMQSLIARIRAANEPPAGGSDTSSMPEKTPDASKKPEDPSTEPKE